ncbi:SAM-dependent methyltransferase [[Limnothrix rosea] IAM M-220]|uniref:SAM-dependent methyltransferase n=1 Tax=[Limnothrix rosea] IAM M-220 TaxID=454133 RepID=UPI0009610E87|nr:class I SAM-dependent methyltransferase [[Limnothrix rosea] IAM M-220]OKH12956.1 SAM-dependent methyltransferase [[Limnothrix rosea] IAM M-220]
MSQSALNLQTAPGHQVLAKAGKTLLRPGGRAATQQLCDWANFQPNDTVLELAASFGYSAIALATKYGVKVVGIERNEDSVAIAQENIAAAEVPGQVQVIPGDIQRLADVPGEFDFVLAEAILTMQSPVQRAKILAGIKERLRPGGRFLSHELLVRDDPDNKVRRALAQAIRVNVNPLTESGWLEACEAAGLEVTFHQVGIMGLLNLKQMLRDEGWGRVLKIGWNVLTKPQLRQRILRMRHVFTEYRDHLGYIVICAQRPIGE